MMRNIVVHFLTKSQYLFLFVLLVINSRAVLIDVYVKFFNSPGPTTDAYIPSVDLMVTAGCISTA